MEKKATLVTARNVQECKNQLINLPADAIIMVDVDDTIIKPASKFFNITSYKTLIDEIKRDRGAYPHYETLLSNWRLQRKVVLVDQKWPSALAELKKRYRVYALTRLDTGKCGAIPSMQEWRYQELKRLGITFTPDTILENYEYTTDLEFTTQPLFYHGIFMTGSASKSQTIALYKQIMATSYFVVIDDKEEHLLDIEDYCRRACIRFLGIHFVAVHSSKQDDADSEVAEFQKRYLLEQGQWLEDDQAAAYIKRR